MALWTAGRGTGHWQAGWDSRSPSGAPDSACCDDDIWGSAHADLRATSDPAQRSQASGSLRGWEGPPGPAPAKPAVQSPLLPDHLTDPGPAAEPEASGAPDSASFDDDIWGSAHADLRAASDPAERSRASCSFRAWEGPPGLAPARPALLLLRCRTT